MRDHGRWDAVAVFVAMLGTATAVSALNQPDQFCTGNPCVISADRAADPNIVLDFGTRTVVLTRQLSMLAQPGGGIGSLTIRCGTFRITGDGYIRGSASGAPAGTLVIEATNAIELNGTTSLGDIRMSGADGGVVTLITGSGSVTGSGRINISNDGLPASGGTLTIQSGAHILLSGQINASGGLQGAGGALDFTAAGNIDLPAPLIVTGGQGGGGFVDLDAGGTLRVLNLDVSGSSEFGDAGLASFDAGGTITVGQVWGRGANDGENCGDAGDLEVFSNGDIVINGPLDLRGRGLDCSGGFLTIDGARVFVNGVVQASGTGTQGSGGDIDITTRELLQIAAGARLEIDGGDSGAGDLSLYSDGDLIMAGTIAAQGRNSVSPGAALAELNARGTLTLSGSVDASGGSTLPDGGGEVAILGCKVQAESTAVVRALGATGTIRIDAHDRLTLRGQYLAGSGGNVVRYGLRAAPPTISAVFSPATTPVVDPLLLPCRVCDIDAHCNDFNDCTVDVCSPDGQSCTNTARTGPCNDGTVCTVDDQCVDGVCVPGAPLTCDDGSTCTLDVCFPGLGCLFVPQGGTCNDGDPCTINDACNPVGVCTGQLLACDDGDPCTDDLCSPGGCTYEHNTAPCNDGDPCTGGDTCSAGTCSGTPLTCDDGDACTIDACLPGVGCQSTPIPACSDADNDGRQDVEDPCTTLDWTSPPTTPPDQFPKGFGLVLSRLTGPDGDQAMLAKGTFNVATSALPIDPAANGVHLYVEDAAGALLDVSLPPGPGCDPRDGWQTLGTPSKPIWKYRNVSGALPPSCAAGTARGVASVQIKDVRLAAKQALQFKFKLKRAALLHRPTQPLTRLQASLALAAQPSAGVASEQAKAGQCAEVLFTGTPISDRAPAPFCKPKRKDGQFDGATCKGP